MKSRNNFLLAAFVATSMSLVASSGAYGNEEVKPLTKDHPLYVTMQQVEGKAEQVKQQEVESLSGFRQDAGSSVSDVSNSVQAAAESLETTGLEAQADDLTGDVNTDGDTVGEVIDSGEDDDGNSTILSNLEDSQVGDDEAEDGNSDSRWSRYKAGFKSGLASGLAWMEERIESMRNDLEEAGSDQPAAPAVVSDEPPALPVEDVPTVTEPEAAVSAPTNEQSEIVDHNYFEPQADVAEEPSEDGEEGNDVVKKTWWDKLKSRL